MSSLLKNHQTTLARALRNTIAALGALLAAILLGLDSPYWSAMTVWSVAQPTRGSLIGKCTARLAGTAAGALVAIPLVHVAAWGDLAFVVALALWVGLCAMVSNVLKGFHTYTSLLAGYTASMVALLALSHPEQAGTLALERVACIGVGVLASTFFTLLWTPSSELGLLRERLNRTSLEAGRWINSVLAGNTEADDHAKALERVISDMAIIDAQCDAGTSGSPAVLHERRAVRNLLVAILDAIACTHALAGTLRELSTGLPRYTQPDQPSPEALRHALSTCLSPTPESSSDHDSSSGEASDSGLREQLVYLHNCMDVIAKRQRRLLDKGEQSGPIRTAQTHREWRDALRTGIRVAIVLTSLGLVWMFTQHPLMLMAILGASILCSVFATMEVPKTSILHALLGTAAGTLAALICTFGLLIHPLSLPTLLLALAPFIFFGAVLLAVRRTAGIGMDYSMTFLLLAAPHWPMTVDTPHFLNILPGPVLGALASALAFHFILPTDPLRRLKDIAWHIVHDIRGLAVTSQPVSEGFWRARALHRAMRLVVRASSAGLGTRLAVPFALASLNLGSDLLRLRQTLSTLPAHDPTVVRAHRLLSLLAAGRSHQSGLSRHFNTLAGQTRHLSKGLDTLLARIGRNLERYPSMPILDALEKNGGKPA